MPFKVEWVIPSRVYSIYAYGKVTIEDYQQVTPIAVQHSEMGEAPVHTISDSRYVTSTPTRTQDIRTMMHSMGTPSEKAGWVVQVTPNPIYRFFGALLVQWFVKSTRYHSAATFHDALCFLKERDAGLSTMNVDEVEAAYEAWRQTVNIEA
ncbi:MAG: hypothetical protein U0670_02255 [Anaerolineae bacterium]